MTRLILIFAAGFAACALIFAAPNLLEAAYVVAWTMCRVVTSGNCL